MINGGDAKLMCIMYLKGQVRPCKGMGNLPEEEAIEDTMINAGSGLISFTRILNTRYF
jgi:hypothetical protein